MRLLILMRVRLRMKFPARSSATSGVCCAHFKIKTYDEDTGYGLLRHVLVRRGFCSGEVMVVLVWFSDPAIQK